MNAAVWIDALFWFFAIVGAFSLITDFTGFFTALRREENEPCVVLTVKDQQDSVEGQLRSIVWQNLHAQNGGRVPKIVVVDLGSSDATPQILQKIAKDYDFIEVTDREGYIKRIKELV